MAIMIEALRRFEGDSMPLERNLMTVQQVAEYLQVHPATVRKWLRERRLTGSNFGGPAGWRIRREDLERFITESQEGDGRGT